MKEEMVNFLKWYENLVPSDKIRIRGSNISDTNFDDLYYKNMLKIIYKIVIKNLMILKLEIWLKYVVNL